MEFKPKPKTAAPQAQTATQPSVWQPNSTTPQLQPVGKTGPWRRPMGLKFPDAREDVQPEAAAKVAGNTAAAKPVAAKPVFTKLTDQQVKDAQAWYAAKKEQYTPEALKQIQKKMGIQLTGKADVATVQAIAIWQSKHYKLQLEDEEITFSVNGIADAFLLDYMFPEGLHIYKNAENFAESMSNLILRWGKLSIKQRKKQLFDFINRTLSARGIPPLKSLILMDGHATGENGYFSAVKWYMAIDGQLIRDANLDFDVARSLVDVVYHLSRVQK